jgi:tetratricopeptide (TPR) repeat protein
MTQSPADPLLAHLRRCCVRVMGESPGCGFFLAPRLLITCSHVVGRAVPVGATVELSTWGIGGSAAGVNGGQSGLPLQAEVLANDSTDDLALLRLAAGSYPYVPLDGQVRVADPLVAIGFPMEVQRLELDQFTAQFEGEVTFGDAAGQGPTGVELKFKGGQVRHGFSGGPLLNRRTWRVIGVVAVTRDARSLLGGFAKPLSSIEPLLRGVGLDVVPVDPYWTDAEALQRRSAEGAAPPLTHEQLLQLRQVLQEPDSPGLQERIQALSSELGKDRFAIRLALQQLGAASEEIPDEQLGRRLLESTEAFERVTQAVLPDLEDPQIAQTFQRGQEALRSEDPDPEAADACFHEATELALAQVRHAEGLEAQAAAARNRSQIFAAEAMAQRAQLALARFDYRQAASWFTEAAQLLPVSHGEKALAYRDEAALALYKQGEEFGDNDGLRDAVAAYRVQLKEYTREQFPLQWAGTQNNLGSALASIGERDSGTERLEEAVVAFREALLERTRQRVPLDWAITQNNLGSALRAVGERDSGTDRLGEAVAAIREALKELTRERVPLDWAMTQNNLGNALSRLAERMSGTNRTNRLLEAVAAYSAALKEYTREQVPLKWAATQNNMGTALFKLGERESGTDRLIEAVEAFGEALKESTRDRVPLDWAMVQNNLGNALSRLAEREGGTERLVEAVAAYREALLERTRERVPLDWAMTQNNMGIALAIHGERESGTTEKLLEAVVAYREALLERTRERLPFDWATTQNNLGATLSVLGERESGTERLEEAVVAYREALKEYTAERLPLQWATSMKFLGLTLMKLAGKERGSERLDRAVITYRDARAVFLSALSFFQETGDNHNCDSINRLIEMIDQLLGDLPNND